MKRRRIRNVRKDKKIFTKTAKRTVAVNVTPKIMRGGFSL